MEATESWVGRILRMSRSDVRLIRRIRPTDSVPEDPATPDGLLDAKPVRRPGSTHFNCMSLDGGDSIPLYSNVCWSPVAAFRPMAW